MGLKYSDDGHEFGVEITIDEVDYWVEYKTRHSEHVAILGVYLDGDMDNRDDKSMAMSETDWTDIFQEVAIQMQEVWR